ncbi:MAG TPA: transglutaminase-like domain-containing protein [Phycisphaerae bacterium]|nr:transglutaminase-like domain-containing protein [Phycisphaerae bacterium]HQL74732.1 transglutaminase-like domain-containing protein [Phycisphaerae bacterium]
MKARANIRAACLGVVLAWPLIAASGPPASAPSSRPGEPSSAPAPGISQPGPGLPVFASPASLDSATPEASMRFELAWANGVVPAIPVVDGQTVAGGADGRVLVRVKAVKPARLSAAPYAGSDPTALAALRPSRRIDSDDPRIARLAREVAAGRSDALTIAHDVERFVRLYVTDKQAGLGAWGSAGEVLTTRRGDCTEHAVLTAALCRAAGVPADVAFGLAYAPRWNDRRHVFLPHVWTRAYVDGQWVGLDAALDRWTTARFILAVSLEGDFGMARPTTAATRPLTSLPALDALSIRQAQVETDSSNQLLLAAVLAAACVAFVIARRRRKARSRGQQDRAPREP